MKNRLNKQEKERLENKTVFLSSIIILYALLLVFIQRMSMSTMTLNGAQAFIEILRWVSLAGAMACAAWSAYKENKGFFTYCASCMFVFLSTTVITCCTKYGSYKPYYINYLALAAVFVLTQVYYALKLRGKMENKLVKNLFVAACAVIFVAFAVVSLLSWNRF